jgi:hypothetical protein
MTAKYRAEYRKQQREKWAAEISLADQEMLEVMRKLRPMTSGGLGDEPRGVASRVLQLAIDDMAGIITGDRNTSTEKITAWRKGRMVAAEWSPPPTS